MISISPSLLFLLPCVSLLAMEPAVSAEPAPQQYDLAKKASEIDPRAGEHSEIGFVFQDAKGKVLELQHATVDTRVKSQGKIVIWLMDRNPGLFERIASYGLRGIRVHSPTAGLRG